MSDIAKVEFRALNVSGDNYLQWALDMEFFLHSRGLGETIIAGNAVSAKDRYKAIFHIRHHLAESLKNQYLTIRDPLELWMALRKRYSHQKTVLLPQAKFDWKNLRIQDFKSVDAYNSELFRIVSILRLCEEEVTDYDLLEKTLSTFHTNNILLQQQYRERRFESYEELISCLLLAEKNNELLMLNSSQRPPGSAPVPEAHQAIGAQKETKESNYVQRDSSSGRGRGRGRNGRGGRGGRGYGRGRRSDYGPDRSKGRGIYKPPYKTHSDYSAKSAKPSSCHKCGMDNHWAKTCRTPRFLCDLYQKHGKTPEANMVDHDEEGDFTHENDASMDYETSDLLKDNDDSDI